MLPMQQVKGKNALAKLQVFLGVPEELKNQKAEPVPDAQATNLKGPQFTLAELAKEIGWHQVE